jgi:hypothetical protein
MKQTNVFEIRRFKRESQIFYPGQTELFFNDFKFKEIVLSIIRKYNLRNIDLHMAYLGSYVEEHVTNLGFFIILDKYRNQIIEELREAIKLGIH